MKYDSLKVECQVSWNHDKADCFVAVDHEAVLIEDPQFFRVKMT